MTDPSEQSAGGVPLQLHQLAAEAAFEQFFTNHFYSLTTWCRYRFGFEEDMAKEAVHRSFIKLWKARHALNPEMPVHAYLHTIIVNTSLDLIKGARNREKLEQYMQQRAEATNAAHFTDPFDVKQLQADIDKAVAALPEQMRMIFQLSRTEGLKHAEIARQLNISINTVETQMTRALKKLRESLAGYLG